MDHIYIGAQRVGDAQLSLDIESLIVLNVYRIAGNDNIKLRVKILDGGTQGAHVTVDMSRVVHEIVENIPEIAKYCAWPVIVKHNYVIAGLCSVTRQIIKLSEHKKVQKLLGFRDACLMACSESSIWTKFCEVDMISTIKSVVLDPMGHFNGNVFKLPRDLVRFEYHLGQPVRMHNVYKIAREQNKAITNDTPIEKLDLKHTFGEGPFMTLSDVILFSCVQIFMTLFPELKFQDKLPLTLAWYHNMKEMNVNKLKFDLNPLPVEITEVEEPEIVKQSLYTADPSRYKPEKRIYTKQKDITNSLRIINNNHIEIANSLYPYGDEIEFDWSKIPEEANPMSGALPENRAYRKCDQLENLAKAVIKLTGGKQMKIVDFCSGSGHLGILLAFLLPQCTIILVENKELSLVRAKERIEKMNLTNLVILQSNLDYFVGTFDIGVSLHACGVATDLVIQNCIKNKAHFVCCPCCYGGIHDCYHLTYPRSLEYQRLNMEHKDYLTLAHAADQTHDPNNRKTTQGFVCMDAIDTDRRLYAESCGYEVHLGKLQPASCTNKNNLLVGICNG
ncbi:glutathione S-transferase C-terminal domain-containing protein [Tribolium castaneum]|uniref:Glutathione S-transferase C-terminal domain-containing protein homolog n=1 Tax=Tribolium castaneum TaxID=7070 RepID=D6WPX7_TRICA|nr:glutathione S-transferase C-terminal domain-containing protein [Tribolium castaneum]EFA06891.1 Glutathione S-transferase C-terminal domain-containing protein homolog-like Protein [Tribolium castaneum]|eukprot:NP_001193392.1 glutathione S-transferase C-terminal domain-containing protein [Tribolium castaneum]